MKKAVFLDKDGTLIEDVPYNVDPAKIRFSHRAFEALKQLQDNEFLLVIITNQSGIALGYFKEKQLQSLQRALWETLSEKGIRLDGFYYCPHAPAGPSQLGCACR